MIRALLTLICCAIAASSYASNIDDNCLMSKIRFQNALEPSGMESTIETAVQLLDNPDSSKEEKYAALPMLGCSKDDAYSFNLIAALDDSDRDIRGGAIIAMRYLRNDKTFPSLIEIITDRDEDENIHQIGSGTLSQIGGDNVEVALAIAEAARDTAQRPTTRFNHVFSLGRLTSSQSISELHTFLDDSDPNVAASSAVALAQHQVRASVPYLVQAELSPGTEYWMKMKAIHELERLTDREFQFSSLAIRTSKGYMRQLRRRYLIGSRQIRTNLARNCPRSILSR